MKVRHKTPTLVSMWMLDVFCCALGCVTLLFLLNSRMATDAVQASRAAMADLQSADKKLAAALTTLEATRLRLTSEEGEHKRLAVEVAELEGKWLALTDRSRELAAQLKAARAEKDETARRLALARDDANATRAALDAARGELAAAQKKAGATAKELADARKREADQADSLKKKQADLDALAKKDADGAKQLDTLQKLMRDKDADRLALERRVAALRKELDGTEAKLRATQRDLDAQLAAAKTAAGDAAAELAAAKAALKAAEKQAADAAAKVKAGAGDLARAKAAAKGTAEELAAAKSGAAKVGEELGAARAQVKDLSKKIDDANATIIDLQGEKAKLADKFNKMQLERESRFAGIAMTGKRAVLLVDMSGSMGKRDLNNVDDRKWPLVIETVGKVMRSIPTLEQYQVIVFSSGAEWLFPGGQWQPYEGEKSVEAVTAALLKVKPRDDTNMYAALDKAFGLRPSGLDTIYLFSDGLPTSGPGLSPAQQTANLSESELGVILGKHVRDTLQRDWNRSEPGRARVKVNSVGFYFESPDVGAFLWSLSRENDGSFVGMSRP